MDGAHQAQGGSMDPQVEIEVLTGENQSSSPKIKKKY